MPLSEEETQIIFICCSISAAFSLVGAIFLVSTYFLISKFRSKTRKLLTILSVTDGALNLMFLSSLWATSSYDWVCRLFTVVVTFLPTCSALWTMCLSWSTLKIFTASFDDRWDMSTRLMHFYHAVCWGYPTLVCALMVAAPNYYGVEDIGCWIPRRPWNNQVWRFACVYCPLWIAWVFNSVVYYKLFRQGRKLVQSQANYSMAKIFDSQLKRMTWVPIAFVIIKSPGMANAIKDIFWPDYHPFFLNILQAIGDQAQATVHSILFVYTNHNFRGACAFLCRRLRFWSLNEATVDDFMDGEDPTVQDSASLLLSHTTVPQTDNSYGGRSKQQAIVMAGLPS